MTDASQTAAPAGGKRRRSLSSLLGFGLGAMLLLIGGIAYYFSTLGLESTDDARIDGHAVSIAAHVAGYVVELKVGDNQRVHAGDVLLRIDPRDYLVARDQARASLALAEAQLSAAETNLKMTRVNAPARLREAEGELETARANRDLAAVQSRRLHAVDQRATTAQTIDQASEQALAAAGSLAAQEARVDTARLVAESIAQAEAQAQQAAAQVDAEKARLAVAELNLARTEVRAPQDGWATKRGVEVGNYVEVGQSLMSLVEPDIWVVGDFKESQLEHMRPGQKVTIRVDAYPDLRLDGHVDGVQMGTGARFSLFPAENATGNFVKIVQRVPVKILIDRGLDPDRPLPLGLSVVPTVDVH